MKQLNIANVEEETFSLKPNNNNMLKCEIFYQNVLDSVHYHHPSQYFQNILGFFRKMLLPSVLHRSDLPVKSTKVRTVHLNCSITVGDYYNGNSSRTIYEFAIECDPEIGISTSKFSRSRDNCSLKA